MLARTFAAGWVWVALAGAAAAAELRVVATIPPIHSLVAAVMQGQGTPLLLVRGGQSPHTYALRPSDANALASADVVFWVGEGLETFMIKASAALGSPRRFVALSEAPGVTLLPNRAAGVRKDHDDDTESPASSEHGHEHRHGRYDSHIWLDTGNASAIVTAIAAGLADHDPARAPAYRANAATVLERLAALDDELRSRLAPLAGRPYVVFHDAYQYFEARYGLAAVGSITASPDRRPGAKTVREIRETIRRLGAVCVFSEPQFEPALIGTLTEGTPARTAVLDPIGADLAPGPETYFVLMRRLASSFQRCLGAEG